VGHFNLGGAIRILVVDDNLDSASVVAQILRHAGHEVVTAGSCEEAKRIFEQKIAELAILDISLPDGDSCGLLHELNNVHNVRAIAITGYAFPTDVEFIKKYGFKGYLIKPFTPDDLMRAVHEVTDDPHWFKWHPSG